MTRMYRCPCCELETAGRKTPISEDGMRKGLAMMLAVGWTPERLIAERSEDLDGIAPGLTDWIRKQIQ
jgi:hypothetical protein